MRIEPSRDDEHRRAERSGSRHVRRRDRIRFRTLTVDRRGGWQRRPFQSVGALHAALTDVVASAPEDRQIALIAAHPDLAGRVAREGRLTAASRDEQAAAGLDRLTAAEIARFDARQRGLPRAIRLSVRHLRARARSGVDPRRARAARAATSAPTRSRPRSPRSRRSRGCASKTRSPHERAVRPRLAEPRRALGASDRRHLVDRRVVLLRLARRQPRPRRRRSRRRCGAACRASSGPCTAAASTTTRSTSPDRAANR